MKRFTLAFSIVFLAVLITFTAVLINNKTEFYQDITLNTPSGRVYIAGVFCNFAGRVYSVFDGNKTCTEYYAGINVGPYMLAITKTNYQWAGYPDEWTVYTVEITAGPDGDDGYFTLEFSL